MATTKISMEAHGDYNITVTVTDDGLKRKLREKFNDEQKWKGKEYDLKEDGDTFEFTKRSNAPTINGVPYPYVYTWISDFVQIEKNQ
jgi:hypothetical protein